MKLRKYKLNNKGYILLEYVLYLFILSLLLISLSNVIITFIMNSNTIDYSIERIGENLTDVLTIKNIILKSDKIVHKRYNRNNLEYTILDFIDDEEDYNPIYNKIKFYYNDNRYEFNDKLGNFENTNNTKIYYYPDRLDLLYINNENNYINHSRVLDLSLYNMSISGKNE